jgi:murein DD-endopeptidase MepM/ murein hydrolase activator NlpD
VFATLPALTLLRRLQEAHPELADVVNREVSIIIMSTTLTAPLTSPQETPFADQPQPKVMTARQQKYNDNRSQMAKYRATARALLNKKTCKFSWKGYRRKDQSSANRQASIYSKSNYVFAVSEGKWSEPGTVSGKFGIYRQSGQWGIKFSAEDNATCYKWPAAPSIHDEIVKEVANLKLAYKRDIRSVVYTVVPEPR